MKPELNLETRRLYLSAALTAQIVRSIGQHVTADSDAKDFWTWPGISARVWSMPSGSTGISFDPPYPGGTAGVEAVSGDLRACCAYDDRGGRASAWSYDSYARTDPFTLGRTGRGACSEGVADAVKP